MIAIEPSSSLWFRGRALAVVFGALVLLGACDNDGSGGGDRPQGDPGTLVLALVEPAEGAPLAGALAPLRYTVSGSRGALTVVEATADGVDVRALTTISGTDLLVTPTTGTSWEPGPLTITITLSDEAGNGGTITSELEVTRLTQALPRANPSTGFAPLTVNLLPDAVTDSVIERYEWEIDGDGLFDEASDTIGRTISWTFDQPGEYPVALRVTDTGGRQSTETVLVVVENRAPVVVAEAVPSNGAVPLGASFTVTASDNEGIALYEIDFEGDGVYDERAGDRGRFDFEYTEPGNFQPAIRVTDTLGLATEIATPDIRVFSLTPGSPSVTLSARLQRDLRVPLAAGFSARVSDPDRTPVATWSWDFEGDGVVDSNEMNRVDHVYERPGIYYATLDILSEDGDITRDIVRIEALPNFDVSYSGDTVTPSDGDSIEVSVNVGGVTQTGLLVEDRGGNVVRTLREMTDLEAGEYLFAWDGTDDRGEPLSNGAYRIVLTYEYRGPVERIDTDPGSIGVPFAPDLISATTGRFQPFGENPVRLEVGMQRAGELTLFMGDANIDQRTKTFFDRKVFGAGQYEFEWHGVDTAGRLVPDDGTPYTIGMFGYTLGDNVVFVRNAPTLDMLEVAPKIYTPDSRDPAGFSLVVSESSRVELQIKSLNTGGTIRTLRSGPAVSGLVTIGWDGQTDTGELPAPGRYSATAVAVGATGARSDVRTNLFHVAY